MSMADDIEHDEDEINVGVEAMYAHLYARTKEFALKTACEFHSKIVMTSPEKIVETARLFEQFLNGDADPEPASTTKN